jgi:hypothetical protein
VERRQFGRQSFGNGPVQEISSTPPTLGGQ